MKQQHKAPILKPSKVLFNLGIFFFALTWLPSALFVDSVYIKAVMLIIACVIGGAFLGVCWFIVSNDLDDELMEEAKAHSRERKKIKKEDE